MSSGVNTYGLRSLVAGKVGNFSPRGPEQNRFAVISILLSAQEPTFLPALLSFFANRSCVRMIAPPLSSTVGFHSVSVCCRPGGLQMLLRVFSNFAFFEQASGSAWFHHRLHRVHRGSSLPAFGVSGPRSGPGARAPCVGSRGPHPPP